MNKYELNYADPQLQAEYDAALTAMSAQYDVYRKLQKQGLIVIEKANAAFDKIKKSLDNRANPDLKIEKHFGKGRKPCLVTLLDTLDDRDHAIYPSIRVEAAPGTWLTISCTHLKHPLRNIKPFIKSAYALIEGAAKVDGDPPILYGYITREGDFKFKSCATREIRDFITALDSNPIDMIAALKSQYKRAKLATVA